ncbi:biofilm peroxide resistance protein BsmA [Pectobacterium carotovorum subsp. carotovorum]|nr:biofilm peroxide resistance protein BsmA [Pectobacterium carotovorum]MCL6338232.1 biofilm peroxide resistance protein BsmA [Pectobacterium carotovorum subsp. carotovorum]MCL6342261.1 biofilm peroxide resistance protein BsmA [Pectobacterium carotovorum subsp. carotovorum]
MNIVRILFLPLILMLSGCQIIQGKPVAAPPLAEKALEIRYAQTSKLKKMGTISVNARGNADDVDRALQQKADASGAHYYVIVLKSEAATLPGIWFARAVLYQ